MTEESDPLHPSDASLSTPCSRTEAMELAIRTAVVAHLVICVLSLALLATLDGGPGILLGVGVAAGLAAVIPFVVLPIAAAIGFFSHLAFRQTLVSIPGLVRILVILFEVSLFGWIVVLIFITRM